VKKKDEQIVIERYSSRYLQHGYSPLTLGWDKGKQDLRYSILFEDYNLEGKSILDIGCGFGDANKIIRQSTENYTYLGVDLVGELIEKAEELYAGSSNIRFIQGNFLDLDLNEKFDIVVCSGMFNFKLVDSDNYTFIHRVIEKAVKYATEGVSCDFLSNKVDVQYEHTFHSDPSIVLNMAYDFSRNVVLKNNYMPFEFSLGIFLEQSFSTDDTIFNRFKNERDYYRFY